MSPIKELIKKARRKPMGESWTYATLDEFEQRLAKLIVLESANYVYRYEELPFGQSYTLAKRIKKHFEIEE